MMTILGSFLAIVLRRLWRWMVRPTTDQDRAYAKLRGCARGLF
jgi:hypothetical protein